MNTNPEFLTTAQAAELLKITPRTVRNMCAAKKIGHLAIDANGTGKKKIYRIPWADFQKYLDSVHVQEESA